MVVDLGVWRLTAYMDTPEDQGPYVGQTASGAPLVAGRTVAVSAATCNRVGLHFGDKLLIDGHVYTLEDHGGSAMNNQDWVDIFVNHPGDEYSERFNRYSHVYLLR
jgi:3D (Asp-Asp-Asp) domain-containing protein